MRELYLHPRFGSCASAERKVFVAAMRGEGGRGSDVHVLTGLPHGSRLDVEFRAMQTYTLGELDDRLTQLDELLFKAKTGQINIKAGEWDALEVEAEAILKTLATELGSRSGKPPQEVYEARSKVRALNEISAMASAILNFIRNPILKPMR